MSKNNKLNHFLHVTISREVLLNILFYIYMSGIILIYIMPYFKYTIPYEPTALLMFISVPFLFFSGSQQRFLSILLACSILLSLLYFTVKIPGDLKESLNETLRNLCFYIPASLGFYAVSHLKNKAKTLLIYSFLLMVFYIILVTITALINNPLLSRSLAEGVTISADTASYRLNNVGGYAFSYMIGVLTLVFIYTFIQQPIRKAGKCFALIAAVLCYVYILESQYTILLLLTMVFSVFIVFQRKSHFILRGFIILFIILLIPNLDSIFIFLSQHLKQQMLATKFYWLGEFFSGNSDLEVLHSRPRLYLEAFLDFCKSPIWGSATESSDNAHSYVLGLLSGCGLLGFSCYLIVFLEAKRHIESCLTCMEKDVSLFRYACWYCFLLSILNPIGTSYEIAILLYFFIPLWISNSTDKIIMEAQHL